MYTRDGPTNGKPLKLDLNQLPTLEAEFKEWKVKPFRITTFGFFLFRFMF